jgi:hypothetical protein
MNLDLVSSLARELLEREALRGRCIISVAFPGSVRKRATAVDSPMFFLTSFKRLHSICLRQIRPTPVLQPLAKSTTAPATSSGVGAPLMPATSAPGEVFR